MQPKQNHSHLSLFVSIATLLTFTLLNATHGKYGTGILPNYISTNYPPMALSFAQQSMQQFGSHTQNNQETLEIAALAEAIADDTPLEEFRAREDADTVEIRNHERSSNGNGQKETSPVEFANERRRIKKKRFQEKQQANIDHNKKQDKAKTAAIKKKLHQKEALKAKQLKAKQEENAKAKENSKKATAPSQCTGKVSLYQHGRFNGKEVKFGKGNYNHGAMTNKGQPNDDVSSLKVPKGCRAILYQHGRFNGDAVEFGPGDYDVHAMKKKGIKNDDVSSLKVKAAKKIRKKTKAKQKQRKKNKSQTSTSYSKSKKTNKAKSTRTTDDVFKTFKTSIYVNEPCRFDGQAQISCLQAKYKHCLDTDLFGHNTCSKINLEQAIKQLELDKPCRLFGKAQINCLQRKYKICVQKKKQFCSKFDLEQAIKKLERNPAGRQDPGNRDTRKDHAGNARFTRMGDMFGPRSV